MRLRRRLPFQFKQSCNQCFRIIASIADNMHESRIQCGGFSRCQMHELLSKRVTLRFAHEMATAFVLLRHRDQVNGSTQARFSCSQLSRHGFYVGSMRISGRQALERKECAGRGDPCQ